MDGDTLDALAPPPVVPPPAAVDEEVVFPLHPRGRALWLFQAAVAVLLGGIPALLAFLLAGNWLLAAAAPVAMVVVMAGVAAYGGAYLRSFRCRLLPDGLLIESGVWWRRETFVPRARIQHTDVEQGPLQRRFGMATLEVYTAGTHAWRLAVHSLPRDSALALRDRLLGRGGSDAV